MTDNRGTNKLMQAFFSPAVALMNRLDVTRKFMLLGLMSLVAIAVVMYSLFASLERDIGFSQRKLQGLELIRPFPRSVQILQQHRGFSAGIIGGDETMRDSRVSTENQAVEALNEMWGKPFPGMTSSEALQHISTDWERLRKEGLSWTAAENFAAHTRLINRIKSFEGIVADEYALTLDPELNTYYLIDTIVNDLPHLLEHFGQLRAYGTGVLASKQATAQQKIELNILVAELDHELEMLKANLDKAGRYNPALQGSIPAVLRDITGSAQQITGLVTSDILTGHFATRPDDFFRMSDAAIDRSYTQIYAALLPMAETLIKARIARAENTLRFSVGIAFLLFLLATYFSVGIIRVIIGNIQSLARSARAFAGGNLSERIELDARDEFGQAGDSFNEMADGFRALLKESRENEARLQDMSAHLEDQVKERTRELNMSNEQLQKEINERKKAENELRVAAAVFETHEAIMITDASANIIRVNQAFQDITGYSSAEVLGKNPRMMNSGRQDRAFYAEMWQQLAHTGAWSGEIWDKRKNGQTYPKWMTVTAVKNEQQETTQYVAIFSDITARKQAEEEIRNLAFYDALTKLPNRRLFVDRFRAALPVSARHNNYGAVLFIDLDKFKTLNDALGHDYGDLLLIEVAARIKSCVREMDTVARLGGDEFVVLAEEISDDREEASRKVGLVAEKIREALVRPYLLKEHEHHSSPSIGISLYRGNEETVDTLLQHADMAMYQAKSSGRNAVRFFDTVMQHNVAAHAELVNDLRLAIEQRQLHLYYQVQVDENNRPLGAEALLRWIHPQRGMVMPEQFIPIAEESTLIIEIDDWVLETACRQLVLWGGNAQTRDLLLTVNISDKQFARPDFVDKVAGILRAHEVNPAHLKLELTEGMVLDDLAGAVKKMHALKALGVSLSMDNFGTRYSSLSYLKQLPLDQLKIDKDFVQAITQGSDDALLVQNIIDLVNNFNLSVIAEGVETEAQLASLKQRECITYQGFLFGKAVPIEEFEALLVKS
ncbi:MAG: EAL domain-containing protein [Betaproteobacteria bacterium]|nr:EAL domain-containing protein [Betaproteobacteria bacterium]